MSFSHASTSSLSTKSGRSSHKYGPKTRQRGKSGAKTGVRWLGLWRLAALVSL
jgi:hypothetical protein